MARHVWSVLCERAIVDRDSESLSLIDVVDAVDYEANIPSGDLVTVPAGLTLVSLWIRSAAAVPEKQETRYWLKSAGGDQLMIAPPQLIPLEGSVRTHVAFEVPFLQIGPAGRYELVVEHRDVSQGSPGPWVQVANVPVDINVGARSPESPPAR